MTLFEKFEEKLERYPGNMPRAAVELAKDWRSDRVLRRLEALLIVADKEHGFIISGTGELIEPDDGILAIGSGGSYALVGRTRARRQHAARGVGDRQASDAHRRRHLHLYEHQHISPGNHVSRAKAVILMADAAAGGSCFSRAGVLSA